MGNLRVCRFIILQIMRLKCGVRNQPDKPWTSVMILSFDKCPWCLSWSLKCLKYDPVENCKILNGEIYRWKSQDFKFAIAKCLLKLSQSCQKMMKRPNTEYETYTSPPSCPIYQSILTSAFHLSSQLIFQMKWFWSKGVGAFPMGA